MDNGTEFHKHFDKATQELRLTHYWGRVRKSTDNAKDERFKRTFHDECLASGTFDKNPTYLTAISSHELLNISL